MRQVKKSLKIVILLELISQDATDCEIPMDRSNIVIDPQKFEGFENDFDGRTPPYSQSFDQIPGQMEFFDKVSDGRRLKRGLYLAQKIKNQILADTNYRCSVGVAANRVRIYLLDIA